MGDSSEAEEKQSDPIRRSRRRRKSKREPNPSTEQSRQAGQSHTQSIYPMAQVKYAAFSSTAALSSWCFLMNSHIVYQTGGSKL